MAFVRWLLNRLISAETRAYHEGDDAYYSGSCVDSNPYPLNTWQHRDWRRGYHRAAVEDDC